MKRTPRNRTPARDARRVGSMAPHTIVERRKGKSANPMAGGTPPLQRGGGRPTRSRVQRTINERVDATRRESSRDDLPQARRPREPEESRGHSHGTKPTIRP